MYRKETCIVAHAASRGMLSPSPPSDLLYHAKRTNEERGKKGGGDVRERGCKEGRRRIERRRRKGYSDDGREKERSVWCGEQIRSGDVTTIQNKNEGRQG